MKNIKEITHFQCEYCHKQFKISDFKNIQEAKRTCFKHEQTCNGSPKINIGDVVIFRDFDNITNENYDYYETAPLYIKKIGKEGEVKIYYCSFVYIDLYNNTYYEDEQTTKKWFKNSEQKYFKFNQYQIDRKLNMKDLIKVNKQLELVKQKMNLYIQYSDRDTKVTVKPYFKQNKIKMLIQVPYKTQR